MNKKHLIIALLATGMVACSVGTSEPQVSSSVKINNYSFTNFNVNPVNIANSNCTITQQLAGFTYDLTCPANSTNLLLSIAYTNSSPASYINPTAAPAGSSITHTGTCSTTPGANYDCVFNIISTNVDPNGANTTLIFGLAGAENVPLVIITFK